MDLPSTCTFKERVFSMAGACVNAVSASFKERFVRPLPFVFPLINLDDFLPNGGKMIVQKSFTTPTGGAEVFQMISWYFRYLVSSINYVLRLWSK